MKKIFLIILSLFFAGCSANYNLTIADSFHESMVVTNDSSYKDSDYYNEMLYLLSVGIPLDINSDLGDKYESELIDNDSYFGTRLKGDFFSDNKSSNIVNFAVDNYDISKNGEKVKLSANGFKVFDNFEIMDELTVNVKCKKKVLKSNADKVKGNVYTWVITKDNYSNKTINLTYIQNDYKLFNDPLFKFGLVLFIIVVIFGLVYVFIKARFLKINKL